MASSGGSLPTFVARRLLITVLLLFLISLGVYSLILIIPGNPAIALAGGTKATPAEIAKITAQLHLNEGFFAQYWRWLKAALHGNLGNSCSTTRPCHRASPPVSRSLSVWRPEG